MHPSQLGQNSKTPFETVPVNPTIGRAQLAIGGCVLKCFDGSPATVFTPRAVSPAWRAAAAAGSARTRMVSVLMDSSGEGHYNDNEDGALSNNRAV